MTDNIREAVKDALRAVVLKDGDMPWNLDSFVGKLTDAAIAHMASDAMVERAARALCIAQHISPTAAVMHGFTTKTALESRKPQARAVIAAITEQSK